MISEPVLKQVAKSQEHAAIASVWLLPNGCQVGCRISAYTKADEASSFPTDDPHWRN